MSILNELTIKNLKLNKKRTIVTIVGIILSTALMVGIGLLFSSFQDYMIRETISYNGKYEAEYNDISLAKLNDIERNDFDYFYQKPIGFSKFDSINEYKPYLYISAVNKEYFNELHLISGRFAENDNELVISKHINTNGGASYKIGDTITLKYGERVIEDAKTLNNNEYYEGETLSIIGEKTYTIVGIVERSNYEDYSASGYSTFTLDTNDKEGTANVYVMFNNNRRIIKQSEDLAKKLDYDNAISYNSTLLALYGESTYGNIMNSMIMMIIIMLSLVSIGCIVVIYNSFAISVMERKKEFGLLSSIGSTKKQLSYTIFFEALIVGTIGIILGIGGAYIGIGTVILIINNLIGDILVLKLNLVTNIVFIIIPVIFMILVIFISALVPSRRAAKVSPIEAIRQNDDIKINNKKIKTGKLVNKLFGIEGEIALKNIKRNKKKYRVTIVSLFISIVLFISFSSYMNYTINTASDVAGEVSYDYVIYYFDNGNTNEEMLKTIDEIVKSNDVKEYISYSMENVILVDNYEYSADYLKYYRNAYADDEVKQLEEQKVKSVSVIVMDDNSYNNYKKELGLTSDKIILLNKFKGVSYGEKRINYNIPIIKNKNNGYIKLCNIADSTVEDIESDYTKYCTKTINNIYITDKYNPILEDSLYDSNYKLIVNKKIYEVVFGKKIDNVKYNIVSDKTDNIDKLAKELDKYDNVSYTNVRESMEQTNNMILVVKILMYGFISLVTLIGVTSVFNTISTSMALRKREFAVLRSIGLTKKGFNKILFFESLFFGLKSLIYAIPTSIGITLIIHYALSDMMSTSGVILPWKAIIVSIVSVFVIVLLTMMYSTNKIKKHNIIEQIREENI